MRKKWAHTMAVLVAGLMLVSAAAPVLAQSDEDGAVSSEPSSRAALTIEAPRRAEVGEMVTMEVSERGSGEAVKDAGVWALTREQAEDLQTAVEALKAENEGVVPADVDQESLIGIYGIFLGRTNGSGQLKHSFEESGWYLLVVVKAGYRPGHTPIGIVTPQNVVTTDSQQATTW